MEAPDRSGLSRSDFGTPVRINILLGGDYYGETLLRDRQWGPRGTQYTQQTCFGWILAGLLQTKDSQPAAYTCCVHLEEDTLKRFGEVEEYNMRKPVLFRKEGGVLQHFESSRSRDEHGRFIVRLPLESALALQESRTRDEERFIRLEH